MLFSELHVEVVQTFASGQSTGIDIHVCRPSEIDFDPPGQCKRVVNGLLAIRMDEELDIW